MIKLKQIILEQLNKKYCIGNCATILDDPNSPFSDATEMAQTIENGEQLEYTYELTNLLDLTGCPKMLKLNFRKHPDKLEFGRNENIYWIYDIEGDIHYFFL